MVVKNVSSQQQPNESSCHSHRNWTSTNAVHPSCRRFNCSTDHSVMDGQVWIDAQKMGQKHVRKKKIHLDHTVPPEPLTWNSSIMLPHWNSIIMSSGGSIGQVVSENQRDKQPHVFRFFVGSALFPTWQVWTFTQLFEHVDERATCIFICAVVQLKQNGDVGSGFYQVERSTDHIFHQRFIWAQRDNTFPILLEWSRHANKVIVFDHPSNQLVTWSSLITCSPIKKPKHKQICFDGYWGGLIQRVHRCSKEDQTVQLLFVCSRVQSRTWINWAVCKLAVLLPRGTRCLVFISSSLCFRFVKKEKQVASFHCFSGTWSVGVKFCHFFKLNQPVIVSLWRHVTTVTIWVTTGT